MSGWGLWGLHTAADWTPPHSSSLPSVGHCGNNEWGEGLCGHLALAFKNMYPDMKLGMEVGSQHGDINHAWAYGEDGRSHDFMGTHDGHPFQMERGANIHLDVDPQDLADAMRIDYNPDDDRQWENFETAQAGHLINRHWLGDDDYDGDDGHYDPDLAEERGHRTASTDGLRYAHLVEADVADDLMKLHISALNQNLVGRLHDEFNDWWDQDENAEVSGGLSEWMNIEKFLRDRYPAAHRGLGMGHEMARPLLDGTHMEGDYMMPGPLEYSYPKPYDTGHGAIAEHGYDPKEIAAGMLLLHNQSHHDRDVWHEWDQERITNIVEKRQQSLPDVFDRHEPIQGDMPQTDVDTLADIAQKRQRMQPPRTAMPNPLPQGVHFRYHPELMWSPGVTAHYKGKMIGSLEWYHDDHVMVYLGTRKPGEIDRISVDPKHQGNSVASSMFDFAKQHEPRLHHSDRLTPDGEGWSAYEKSRHAAFNQDLVDRLHDEFHQWWDNKQANDPDPSSADYWKSSEVTKPIQHWPHIEEFLSHHYPAAHRDHEMGFEEARHILDGHDPMPYQSENESRPYETGPEAVARHGYDPAEITAGMLLLHNKAHPFRGDLAQEDQDRLNDIFDKRVKMQRDYEQRRNARLAMAWDEWAPQIKHWQYYDEDFPEPGNGGSYYIEHRDLPENELTGVAQSHLDYDYTKPGEVNVSMLYAHEDRRKDGVAEALMRRLHEDHPGYKINPGQMTTKGQAFHDRMLEKEPDARGMLTASIVRTAGLHGDLPEDLTFQHHPEGFEPFPDVIQPSIPVSNSYPTVSAHDGDRMIGHIQWRDDGHPRRNNEIWDLRVHPEYQRRGVATALFDWTTDQINPDLKHSNNLSDEGRAFAEAEDARPLAQERYEAWRNKQPMPKRFAGRNGPPPPMTFEPFNTMWSNGIMARHAEDGRPIAHLHWHPDGEIESIRVHPELQGRDIAKHVLAHAATHPETFEARQGIKPSNHLTNAGRAFARSLGHDPADDEVEIADDDTANWGWTAVDNYTPMHVPYTGQNEDEMSHHLDKPWTPPERTANTHGDGWPAWWRGRNHPNVPWDKRWHPNHPQHVPGPWDK